MTNQFITFICYLSFFTLVFLLLVLCCSSCSTTAIHEGNRVDLGQPIAAPRRVPSRTCVVSGSRRSLAGSAIRKTRRRGLLQIGIDMLRITNIIKINSRFLCHRTTTAATRTSHRCVVVTSSIPEQAWPCWWQSESLRPRALEDQRAGAAVVVANLGNLCLSAFHELWKCKKRY